MYDNTPTFRISDITTSDCRISQTKRTISKYTSDPFFGRCKIDSHSGTIVTGKNCVILKYTDSCDVAPFPKKYTPMKDVTIASAAKGYTSSNGSSYILVFNEALYMEYIDHTLINPNQCRNFGVEVQENPYNWKNPMTITSLYKEFVA